MKIEILDAAGEVIGTVQNVSDGDRELAHWSRPVKYTDAEGKEHERPHDDRAAAWREVSISPPSPEAVLAARKARARESVIQGEIRKLAEQKAAGKLALIDNAQTVEEVEAVING